ncbi:MAG: hypothetical protein B7X11_04315, partial [Acidobacteria bacterium 37-65-4]
MHPLIYDWNTVNAPARSGGRVMLDDETLRDGLQSPSVRTPTIEQKLRILHLIDSLGIETADIGLPGAGPHVVADVERLAREIVQARLTVQANCAARTVVADIKPIAEVSQRVGLPIECCAFIGSSPIRQYAEDWTLDRLQQLTDDAISFAVKEGLTVMYVTEDTTRADPESLRRLLATAIRAGAKRLCIADTVGHATPHGAAAVTKFVVSVIEECGATGQVGIDWHGHRDRDLAVINSLAAMDADGKVHGHYLTVKAAQATGEHQQSSAGLTPATGVRQAGASGLRHLHVVAKQKDAAGARAPEADALGQRQLPGFVNDH